MTFLFYFPDYPIIQRARLPKIRYIPQVNAHEATKIRMAITGTCKGIGRWSCPISRKAGPTIKRQKQGDKPNTQKGLLHFPVSFFYPSGEERHVKVKSYDKVDIPHVVFFKREVERYHCHIFQRVDKRLGFMALYVTKKSCR